MGLFARILGSVASFFQIGGPNGPGFNDNAGALEAKNSTNTAFTIARGADPVNPNDFVTLESLSSPGGTAAPPRTLNRFEYWGGTTNGATLLEGFCNCFLGQAGAGISTVVTAGSLLTSTKRAKFTAPAGSGAVTLGTLDATGLLNVWRGSTPGLGGFTMRLRFGFEAAATGAPTQMLAGLISQSGTSGAQNWTTQLTFASIGVGFSQTPVGGAFAGNWKLITSIGNGVTPPTVLDLGPTLPVNTTSLMQLDLVAAPNAPSITYTLTDLSTGNFVTGVAVANIPLPTQFLAMWCAASIGNGGTTPCQFDVAQYCYQQNF